MIMIALYNVLLLLSISITLILAETTTTSSSKLQVHLVGHSHDDPGWLKTVDQYYTGANSSIYLAHVQYIFDNVITELNKDKTRKYTMCEISFFARWWHEQNDKMKENVQELINNEQIHFVNGGWVMHDEAGSHYVSMIDQTTLGHQFLLKELNYRPRVGWQIDPFGHSKTHAWLSSQVGFDALYFGRIDYQDRAKRMKEKRMEFVWEGSYSNPSSDTEVFTGAFTSGNYGPPEGFCFDSSCVYCRDDPIVDDKLLETYNMEVKAQAFIDAILEEQSVSMGNNIMLKIGADFTWDNARTWFSSVDKLIKYINENDERFNLFWSDPVSYTKARANENIVWTNKDDDFFPYSDCEHGFWAGYFTSRPTLKYFERQSSAFLQTAKQILSSPTLTSIFDEAQRVILQLTAAVGLVNHHDAVTGTSKQHVAEDYKKILSKAVTETESLLSTSIASIYNLPEVSICRYTNESICEVTQSMTSNDEVVVLVYNPLPRARSQQVTVFLSSELLSSNTKINVLSIDSSDKNKNIEVSFDIIPDKNPSTNTVSLIFTASANALSTSTYIIQTKENALTDNNLSSVEKSVGSSVNGVYITITNDLLAVTFNQDTGLMETIKRLDYDDVEANVSNNLKYYKSYGSPGLEGYEYPKIDNRDPHLKNIKPAAHHVGSPSDQPSGAYVFRSSTANEKPTLIASDNVELKVIEGKNVIEVRQKFSSWASQIVRLRKGSPALEFEWTIGPVPIDDNIGKEVISEFESSLYTGPGVGGKNHFFTDSNGREFLERVYNYRPTWDLEVYEPIAGNYYPLTAAMYVQDKLANVQLSVLTDRSQAAASLRNGEMELMIHRRLLADDNRGVQEPLNETIGGMSPYPTYERSGDGITVTGKHYLLLSKLSEGMKETRTMMDEAYQPFQLFFAKESSSMNNANLNIIENINLPVNVQLVTFEKMTQSSILIRFAHQFAINEDPVLSKSVSINLNDVLHQYNIKNIREVTLSANQDKFEQLENKIVWKSTTSSSSTDRNLQEFSNPLHINNKTRNFIFTISAMQIKTFIVDI